MVYFLIGTPIKGNENSTVTEIKNQVGSNASLIKQINVENDFNVFLNLLLINERRKKRSSKVKVLTH